ncbi:heavy metal-binding domain-containing protein [Streptomyces murinus]|uniref:heavy metal-binding domain-containing protein n=1 Tax=Streptomyces murinus TaxID=33900 RepID=UPI000A389775|nr:heavy metal-binding domain-containing protein [Streptomyces murinus]
MLMSTLPDLAGRSFEVRGVVYSSDSLTLRKNKSSEALQGIIQELCVQAAQLGADAIVDLKTALGGQESRTHCVMTGTAVKLL